MSYFVNKTDGSVIVVLDGTKDTTSTSLTLFGRLVQNYGDQTNENFVHLLENFAFGNSPANPIYGQLWFDTSVNNLKAYTTANTWVIVGSDIQGNLDVAGNIQFGPYNFALKDLDGNVQITNSANVGNVSFYANVNGVSSRVLHVDGNTGLIDVYGNATTNFGVPTKIYVDSELQALQSRANTNLVSNVNIINANLAVRTSEENQIKANIIAANAQIALRDTIARVNSINSAIDTALTANVDIINANLVARLDQTVAVNTAMIANVSAANARVNAANVNITTLINRLDAVNTAIDVAVTANLALKAPLNDPALTGTPTAPTAAFGANTLQLATTNYVMIRSEYWSGSRKFVSTSDPDNSFGSNGDFWFKYTP
jgi:hypothetical protein